MVTTSSKRISQCEIFPSTKIIANYAFYYSEVTSVTIPGNVDIIGDNAFYTCRDLTSVTMNEGITVIGSNAFSGCTSLASVNIPESVTQIKERTFYRCVALTQITIPGSVTQIGDNAFEKCNALQTVSLEKGIQTVGAAAFADCTALSAITIPDSVTAIGSRVFAGTGLQSMVIPDSVITMGSSVVYGCNLESLQIPFLGESRENASGIFRLGFVFGREKNADIPSSLKSVTVTGGQISKNAFDNCKTLETVVLGDGVTSVGSDAFSGSNALKTVRIGNGATAIGDSVFRNCSALTTVQLGNSITSIGKYAFYNCTALSQITLPESLYTIGICAFSDCTSLNQIQLPGNLEGIPKWCFENCTSLTEIKIPGNILDVGMEAFAGCSGLTKLELSDGLSEIGQNAFSKCTGLTEVTVPQTVTTIGKSAFCDCTSLQRITIPFIGESAQESDGTFRYIFGSTIPSSLKSVTLTGSELCFGAFDNCSELEEIILPENISVIPHSAFRCCTALKSFTVADNITEIGPYAFDGCTGLTEVHIGGNVTTIDDGAFAACKSLEHVVIPDSVTYIGNYAFRECEQLKSVVIGNGVERIGFDAFNRCYALEQIDFNAASVEPVSADSFSAAGERGTGITVKIGANVTKIPANLFASQVKVTEVIFEEGSTCKEIGKDAFAGCGILGDVYYPGTGKDWNAITIQKGNQPLLNARFHFSGVVTGDLDSDGELTTGDAVYLLLHVMFGAEDYPILSGTSLDFNASGAVDTNDAVYLLLHVMFGAEDYPICDHKNTESVVVPGTCNVPGYTEIICKDCGYSYKTEATPGTHNWTTMVVSEAADICNAHGNSSLLKYKFLTDVCIDICPTCGLADFTTVRSAYTPEEETAIMLELMRPVREARMREMMEGTATEAEIEQFIKDYQHVVDQTCIDHAVRRSKEIVYDYSHNGAPYGCAENISGGPGTIEDDFLGWKNSQGHYENMTSWGYPYFGYARYIYGDPDFETIHMYSVQIFGYYDRG